MEIVIHNSTQGVMKCTSQNYGARKVRKTLHSDTKLQGAPQKLKGRKKYGILTPIMI